MSTPSAGQTAPTYVVLNEGIKMLGVHKSNFLYYVRVGQIRKDPTQTKRPARYNTDDIQTVKSKLAEKRSHKTSHKFGGAATTSIDWVRLSDTPNMLKLVFSVFGEAYPGGIDRSIAWLRRNANLTLAAFDAQDRSQVWGYVSLLPLPEPTILDILRGERQATSVQAEEIETFERTGPFTLFAESVIVHPNRREQVNLLLRHWLQFWCDQYPDRQCEKIYAQSTNQQSDILIQKLFFAPRYDLAENAFMLDLKRPGASRFIRRFQECVREK